MKLFHKLMGKDGASSSSSSNTSDKDKASSSSSSSPSLHTFLSSTHPKHNHFREDGDLLFTEDYIQEVLRKEEEERREREERMKNWEKECYARSHQRHRAGGAAGVGFAHLRGGNHSDGEGTSYLHEVDYDDEMDCAASDDDTDPTSFAALRNSSEGFPFQRPGEYHNSSPGGMPTRTILGGEVPTLVSLHDSNDSPLRSSAESTPDWYYGDEESGVLVDGRRPAFVSASSPEVERRGFSTVDISKYEQHLDRPLGFLPRAPLGGVSYSDGDSGQDSNATTSDDDDGDEEGGNEGDDDDDDEEGSSDKEEGTAVEASNNFDEGREQEPMGGSDGGGDHPSTRTEQA
ncbi:Nucleolar protein 14-like [Balamuthia mandrillaris]